MIAHRERRPRRRAIPWRGGAIAVAATAAVAAVAAIVIALASPGGREAAGPTPRPSTAPPTATKPSNAAGEATVAVLNGTMVTGLARAASDDLEAYGFREGVVTNDATNQQRERTEIFYEPGFRQQAQTAAGCLDVGLDRIHPMTENARVLGDRADIVVFIGVDKAR